MSDEEKSDFSKNYFDKITMGFQVFVIFPDALAEREAISVADVGRKLDPSKSFLVSYLTLTFKKFTPYPNLSFV